MKQSNLDQIIHRIRESRKIAERLGKVWEKWRETTRRANILGILDTDYYKYGDTIIYDIFMAAFNAKTSELGVKGCDFSFAVLMDIFGLMERYAKLWAFS
jgi:hypothetical protein